jgi:hypothetical protein
MPCVNHSAERRVVGVYLQVHVLTLVGRARPTFADPYQQVAQMHEYILSDAEGSDEDDAADETSSCMERGWDRVVAENKRKQTLARTSQPAADIWTRS